ncbi:RGS domain-containing protein [Naegleria gruberi]|uniref:RGS domain-containing protein n=1 Tax=Naegleria gruberi TaxID=5762 RepID=D2V8S7_NAEGR|nr:RGS domain-containing protein [Naegleria gruberi]EFC46855.1 RGS domain-containing protein [Naegleria gruberi]|eukprot:XP_002679599.1 RGS domain-containing protein [Naegleria gruberi strain NEG-M]
MVLDSLIDEEIGPTVAGDSTPTLKQSKQALSTSENVVGNLKQELSKRQRGVYILSIILGLVLALVALCVTVPVTSVVLKTVDDNRMETKKAQVTQVGLTAYLAMKRQIELSMSSLVSIAQVIYSSNYTITDSSFADLGSRLNVIYPELAQFEIDKGLVLSFVYGKVVGSEAAHLRAINRAIELKETTIFGPIYIKRLATAALITQYPLFYPNQTFWGLSSSIIYFTTLFNRINLHDTLKGYEYQLYEYEQNRIFLEARNGTNMTTNGITTNLTSIDDAISVNMTILNSEYKLLLKPLQGWTHEDTYYVEIAFGIVLNFILAVLVILAVFQLVQDYFRKKEYLIIQNKLEIKVAERTKDLAQSHQQLSVLLDKISLEEQRTRRILNTIDDAVITILTDGSIIHCNNAFYNMFSLTEIDLRRGEKDRSTIINSILPKLNLKEMFEKALTEGDEASFHDLETVASSKVGIEFNVRVSINFCKMLKTEANKHQSEDKSTEEISDYILVCVLLIHNHTDKTSLLKHLKEKETQYNKLVEKIEFKEMFDNHTKRNEFKEFCIKEHNEESILFLEDVQFYKMLNNLQQRSELQKEMYQKYLAPNAPKLLNISSTELDSYRYKINSGIGQQELFSGLEDIVVNNIIFDSFKRWTTEKQKHSTFSKSSDSLPDQPKHKLSYILNTNQQ